MADTTKADQDAQQAIAEQIGDIAQQLAEIAAKIGGDTDGKDSGDDTKKKLADAFFNGKDA